MLLLKFSRDGKLPLILDDIARESPYAHPSGVPAVPVRAVSLGRVRGYGAPPGQNRKALDTRYWVMPRSPLGIF